MKPEHQANILAKQAAFAQAAKRLAAAQAAKLPPEEIRRLRDIYDALEAEYEQAIDAASNEEA